MTIDNRIRTKTAARLAAGILLAATAGVASAHGAGALSHAAAPAGVQPGFHAPMSSRAMPAAHPAGLAASGPSGAGGSSGMMPAPSAVISTLPPTVAAQCEGEVSVNCEATARSRATVSNDDPDPIWSAPVPTTVPATPPTDPIAEPQDATPENFEQSGGASGVETREGGGPTLADCMSLWEPAVHMSRPLWKDVCIRTMNGIDEPQVALGWIDPAHRGAHGAHQRHAAQETHGRRTTSRLERSPHS